MAQEEKLQGVEKKQFMGVKDIMKVAGVSESYAYKIIRELNQDLAAQQYFTIRGKVPTAFFEERFYGVRVVE